MCAFLSRHVEGTASTLEAISLASVAFFVNDRGTLLPVMPELGQKGSSALVT